MGYGFITFLKSLAVLSFFFLICFKVLLPFHFFKYFEMDSVSINLSFISLIFVFSYLFFCFSSLKKLEIFCLAVSILSSLLCFFSSKILIFWMSYEMTIMPLLVCLYSSSPYSERFLAGWYLLFYILMTSVPLLVLFFYSMVKNKSLSTLLLKNTGMVSFFLFLLFMTKVPLPPFHAWLPMVHAEASTFVSVVLSGYVMKLGMVGIFRFCSQISKDLIYFLSMVFFLALFFFVCSCSELDSKRWLAFLSLIHIFIAIIGFCYLKNTGFGVITFFCLGHGLSAGLLFYLFKVCYELVGSRKWVLVGLDNVVSKTWRFCLVVSLLTVASFPPSISFLTEVVVLSASISKKKVLVLMGIYLFLGGLMPVLLLSYLLINCKIGGVFKKMKTASYVALFCLAFLWLFGCFIF